MHHRLPEPGKWFVRIRPKSFRQASLSSGQVMSRPSCHVRVDGEGKRIFRIAFEREARARSCCFSITNRILACAESYAQNIPLCEPSVRSGRHWITCNCCFEYATSREEILVRQPVHEINSAQRKTICVKLLKASCPRAA